MKRAIISNQTVEQRLDQVCAELELKHARENIRIAAEIILDLELHLRDCSCDLLRAQQRLST